MDAAFFRFLGPELASVLKGVRIDTVFSPAPGFWTFAFSPPVPLPAGSEPACRFLLVRAHARDGILFLSGVKPVNPMSPPAKAMWLRKRLRNRKVAGGVADWPGKRLALELSPGEGRWLLLSMEEDPAVLERLPDGFGDAPGWASAGEAHADPACPRSLRRAIEREDPGDRDAFLADFLAGRARGFFLDEDARQPGGPLPWPAGRQSVRCGSALEAAALHARDAFFAALAPPDDEPKKAEARKQKRLAHLEKDRQRLQGLERQHLFGEAVAANLSSLDPKAKSGPVELPHPELGAMLVPLDPSVTILQNMERFFRKAAKGRRGQVHVDRLKAEAEEGRLPPRKALAQDGAREIKSRAKPPSVSLHRFRSSDGFVILRGRNSAANHRLLSEIASPFDYWFHAEGGPGAHVILRRDSPGRDVPGRSMEEAAAIAALASWRAADAKADVLVALASEVRKVKGAALGQVRLDKARTLRVSLDPSIEDALRDDS